MGKGHGLTYGERAWTDCYGKGHGLIYAETAWTDCYGEGHGLTVMRKGMD